MKKIIIAFCSILSILLFSGMIVFAAGGTPVISVSEVSADEDTVDIPISIENNTGICGATLKITYNENLTLTSIKKGSALSALTMTRPGNFSDNPVNIVFDGVEEDSTDGEVFILTFKVPDKAGKYNVDVSYEDGDIINGNVEAVNPIIENGCVVVSKDSEEQSTDAKVTFNVNGGDELDENIMTITVGNSYGTLPTPKYTGYDFIGWFTEAESGTQVKADDLCSADITLYAHWKKHVHTVVIDQAEEASCEHTGMTEGSHCAVCGEVIVEQKEVPLTDHTGGRATCKDKAICSICGEEYGELNSSRHSGGTEIRNQIEATSTEEGYTGDTYCLGCGALIKLGETISVTPSEDNQEIKVQNASGFIGQDVTVPVTIDKNTGIAGFSFDISYDTSILTLKSISSGSVLGEDSVSTNGNVVNWYSSTSDNVTANGEILLLTFTISNEAEAESTKISVAPHDGKKNLVDEDGNYVDVNYQYGKLEILKGITGDVNGDRDITIADVVLLNSCVLGKKQLDSSVFNYADINSDGYITIGDVVMLNRHVLGKETISEAKEYLSAMEDYLSGGGYAIIRVSDVNIKPGATISVPIYIEDNSGIAGMALTFSLPKGVTLNYVTKGSMLSDGNFKYSDGVCTWYSENDVIDDGILLTLNITADENVSGGSIKVKLKDNDTNNLTDMHGGTMAIDFVNGQLNVENNEICDTNGHTEGEAVVENEIEAFCQGGSYDLVVYCTECGEELSRETVELPAGDHSWNTGEVTKAVTCTVDGEMTYTCEICSETKTEIIPATGHTPAIDKPIEATCTENGSTKGSYCSLCGAVLEASEEIPAYGHVFTNYVSNKNATCTADGTKTAKCDNCDVTNTIKDAGTAKGHKLVTDKAVAATVFKTGKTAGKHCSVCKKVITAQKTIAKLKPTIKLSKTSVTVKKKKTVAIKVSKLAKGDSVKSWKSGNKKIATVTSKGVIKGVKKGKTTITVTLKSGKKATVKVKVK